MRIDVPYETPNGPTIFEVNRASRQWSLIANEYRAILATDDQVLQPSLPSEAFQLRMVKKLVRTSQLSIKPYRREVLATGQVVQVGAVLDKIFEIEWHFLYFRMIFSSTAPTCTT